MKKLVMTFGIVFVLLASAGMTARAQSNQNNVICSPTTNTTASGQNCYTPLQPAAFAGITGNTTDLGSFLGSVFNWGIAVAVALALIMIIWGGIEKMTTDSWQKKDEGQKRIENALWGLGLALVSWLILYIINPTLVTFSGNTLLNSSVIPVPQTSTNSSLLNTAGQTTNASSPSGNAAGCSSCVPASQEGLTCKTTGCELNQTLATELAQAFSQPGVPAAQVTEGYPPTVDHISACHQNGTCADVNLVSKSTSVSDVGQLYNAMIGAGLNPAYETASAAACQPYITANIKCIVASDNTAPSFHVNM
ncbi:MAG: hypothetical protein KGH93_00945 [Patescibacteria group bacterium]|nr:hypothetical protein [Patescibacteria group bacterium]MDE1945747.1 hypothetical protein [Patescibacteria group bacterium]